MKIKKSAIGNSQEAFIENSFSDGINIISSDDNNKGKTIVIQSLMYALGNDPTFPTSFDYKQYYHYVEFEEGGTEYRLCRHNNGFVLKYDSILMIFDSVSELKRYWTKHIFRLPVITKNQISKIVDPVLFLQLFFVGQDKKDTSNIAHSGLYNKQDYYNMIYDICDVSGIELNDEEIKKIKNEIKALKDQREIILKQYKILKSQKTAVSYLSSANDRIIFEKKLADMEKIRSKIEELRKERNRAATRKSKWDTTLKELRSLNRTLDCGELRCMDCDSTNISFSASKRSTYTFDVSSAEMRTEIIASITDQSDAYKEEMDRLSAEISSAQDELQALMSDESISLESIVAFKEEIFSASDAEQKIRNIDNRLTTLNSQLQAAANTSEAKKEQQSAIFNLIVSKMNEAYKSIDPNGNLLFADIFTKRDEVFSGSEETVFHIVKLYALRSVLGHNYPIVIDSFRAEDLSTQKESLALNLFKEFDNQVILTTTLKKEEMGKYDTMPGINHIDYKSHQPSKMLSEVYSSNFVDLLQSLSLSV